MTILRLSACALAAGTVLSLVHVLARVPRASVDLSRTPPAKVEPALRERLARLDSDLLLTYAASPEETLPSGLRGVPREVEALLRAIEEAARENGRGRVRVQIVDPTSDPAVASWLGAVLLAPFRARSLEVDREVERSVWSSLRIAYGPHGAAAIENVTRATLADLQALLAAHLDLLERPRRPRVALAAPLGFQELRRSLRARAELLECDFAADAIVPGEADILLWIDPDRAEPAHLAALRALLDRGRSAVIAGSAIRADFAGADRTAAARFERTSYPTALPRAFGLAAVDAVLLEDGALGPSPLVRSIGADQDFRPLAGGKWGVRSQPNGSLLFASPTAFVPAAGRLKALGLALFPLASSSVDTRLRAGEETSTTAGVRAPRSTLLALVAPAASDPRRGSLVFAASSSPFSDEYLRHEGFAHEALLDVLVGSLASPDRMAIATAAIAVPPSIPELPAARKILLSAVVALALPLLALLVGVSRAVRRPLPAIRLRQGFLVAACAAASILLLARFAPAAAALDLTREGRNGLAPETGAILSALASPVRIELLFSDDSRLPPRLRASVREARELALRFADAATSLTVVEATPDENDAGAIAALARAGVLPLDALPEGDAGVGSPRVFAAMRLEAGLRTEILRFPGPASFEHLEFRLASALARLAGGARAPRIAVLASAPRSTPAEALDYQERGLFPPGGGDHFGEARALLEANDFAVRAVDASGSDAPQDADLLVCLEPRRDARPMVAAAANRLARGGSVLLAAQHYGLRSRRVQKAGLEAAGRPEPWFADLDRLYFPSIGIELVREVLLDEVSGTAEVETEIEREPGRFETTRERMTSPLLVRAAPPRFERSSPVVRGVSELILESPSRLRVDAAKLAAHGISAREILATSERTWSFDWKGGDLPEALLHGPLDGRFLGPQPLAMLFEGRFPPPGTTPDLAAVPGGDAGGRLLLLGSSQVFRDESLRSTDGDAGQLLLNAVAALALPPDLGAILARRAAAPAIGLVLPREKILWRFGVVGAAPAILLVLGLLRARRRPRAAR